MANEGNKFLLPSPKFQDEVQKSLDDHNRYRNPHFSTPHGMLLPRDKQPPPMYGPRGSTIPPQYMSNQRKRSAQSAFLAGAQHQGQFQHNAQQNPRHSFNSGRHSHNAHGRKPHGAPQHSGPDKEVIPDLLRLDWKLWCEGCDVNCRSDAEYVSHVASHVACSVAECKFVGHPMIMKRHARQVHNTEAAGKESGPVPSREEIQQWREERRKRFPTKDNIILRQQAQEERLKRGERITANKQRFPNHHAGKSVHRESIEPAKEPTQTNLPKRQKKRKRNRAPIQVAPVELKQTSGRIPFQGTSSLWKHKDQTNNALGMLGEYGTGSDDSFEETEEVREDDKVETTKKDASVGGEILATSQAPAERHDELSEGEIVDEDETLLGEPVPVPSKHHDILSEGEIVDEDETLLREPLPEPECASPGVMPAISKDGGADANTATSALPSIEEKDTTDRDDEPQGKAKRDNDARSNNQNKKHKPVAREGRKQKKWLLDYSKLYRTKQNTMLEKLLDSDIRHERNILLQCVRHVVMNNFFGIGSHAGEENACSSNTADKIDE